MTNINWPAYKNEALLTHWSDKAQLAIMATGATDCDFLYNGGLKAELFEQFMSGDSSFEKLVAYTPHDEHSVYDVIDVSRRSELRQDGKVVVITGAGRGIGRVSGSAVRCSTGSLADFDLC